MRDNRERPRGDPQSRPLPAPPDSAEVDDPTEAYDQAVRDVERVVRYQARGVSQAPTVIDPARRPLPLDVQAQLDGLTSSVKKQLVGSKLHYRITTEHTYELGELRQRDAAGQDALRWVIVGTVCATLLSLAAVAGVAYTVGWLLLRS